jgi:acetyl esterase/lipase
MIRKKIITFLLSSLIASSHVYSQRLEQYKQIDSTKLFLEIYYPETFPNGKKYPTLIFFFGGGWKSGDRYHFAQHAKYFSKRGMICILSDYRTESLHRTTPFESLKDAKSAIRYIKQNANTLQIDTSKIVAAGGSAGGHLAAATALINEYNETSDNIAVSCKPHALVLFNPVFDNGPGGYGYDRIGDAYKEFSPLHNLKKGAPPTIVFLGTNDRLIPVETAKYYGKVMEKVGSRFDLKLYDGEGHGFFNYAKFEYYKKTLMEADKFLVSLGYLEEEPIVKIE